MADNISFTNNEDIERKINIIIGQTDYTYEISKEKLQKFNYDEIAVIRDYFGISPKKQAVQSSLNQEIYKQIRLKLDKSMKDYNDRKTNN
jgi:hypothetical protein